MIGVATCENSTCPSDSHDIELVRDQKTGLIVAVNWTCRVCDTTVYRETSHPHDVGDITSTGAWKSVIPSNDQDEE